MKLNYRFTAIAMVVAVVCMFFGSCEEERTYANQKKAERRAISAFISNGCLALDSELGDTLLYVKPVKEISESMFTDQDSVTNLKRNEYVKLGATGVYMQIVRKGAGEKLKDGETARILVRYIEYNISGDSIQSRNNSAYTIAMLDQMTVTNTGGTLTGTFLQGQMKRQYGSAQVPEAWLIPLHYVNIGRQDGDDEIAKVRIITPHSSGQSSAIKSVYPCFYELTFQRSR